MNASQLLVKCLENEEVEYIFGIPGEEMVMFLDALKNSSIQFITTADERGASFMAAAYGRLTGKAGVVVATLGPGALNIPNGLAFATLSGFPLVALTWQRGLREGVKDNGFQYVNIANVLAPTNKYSSSITSPLHIPSVVRNAFRISQSQKCGASHIQLYEDVINEIIQEETKVLSVGKLIETIAKNDKISRHIHLPVQSGDDTVLKRMNRWYTRDQYLALISNIRNQIPNITFSTDFIVGFCGETEEQFQNTADLAEQVGFTKAYVAMYSDRPVTAAHKAFKDDVPHKEKKRRWKILDELINQKNLREGTYTVDENRVKGKGLSV